MPHIFYSIVTTNRGDCGLIWSRTSGKSMRLLRVYPVYPDNKLLLRAVRGEYPAATAMDGAIPRWLRPLQRFLMAYYSGDKSAMMRAQLDWNWLEQNLFWDQQSEFTRKVLATAYKIKPGTTISYGELARRIARPRAARAVGGALSRNPWPVLIPCHRVIGSDGSMTGFSGYGSVAAKKRMLEIER